MARSHIVFPLILVGLLLAMGGILMVLSSSATIPLPVDSRVYSAETQLAQLNRQVHSRVLAAWAQERPVTPSKAVLALLVRTKSLLGLEAQMAIIRLPGEREQRAVMAWSGRYYDPVLDQCYTRADVATVVRTVGYNTAITLKEFL